MGENRCLSKIELWKYLDGTLDEPRIINHVNECPKCRNLIDTKKIEYEEDVRNFRDFINCLKNILDGFRDYWPHWIQKQTLTFTELEKETKFNEETPGETPDGCFYWIIKKEINKISLLFVCRIKKLKGLHVKLKAGPIIREFSLEEREESQIGYKIIFTPYEVGELPPLNEWQMKLEAEDEQPELEESERELIAKMQKLLKAEASSSFEMPEFSIDSTETGMKEHIEPDKASQPSEELEETIPNPAESELAEIQPTEQPQSSLAHRKDTETSESSSESAFPRLEPCLVCKKPIDLIQRAEILKLPEPYWTFEQAYLQEFPELHILMDKIVWSRVNQLSNPFLHNRVCASLAFEMSKDISPKERKVTVVASLLNNIVREESELLTDSSVFNNASTMVDELQKKGFLKASPRFWGNDVVLKHFEIAENIVLVHHITGAAKAGEIVRKFLNFSEDEIYEIQAAILQHSTGYFYFRDYVDMILEQQGAWEVVFPLPENQVSKIVHDADLVAQFIPESVLHEGSKWKKIARNRWGASNLQDEAHIIYYVFSLLLKEAKTDQGKTLILKNWDALKQKLLKHMGLQFEQDPIELLGKPQVFNKRRKKSHRKIGNFAYATITESSECMFEEDQQEEKIRERSNLLTVLSIEKNIIIPMAVGREGFYQEPKTRKMPELSYEEIWLKHEERLKRAFSSERDIIYLPNAAPAFLEHTFNKKTAKNKNLIKIKTERNPEMIKFWIPQIPNFGPLAVDDVINPFFGENKLISRIWFPIISYAAPAALRESFRKIASFSTPNSSYEKPLYLNFRLSHPQNVFGNHDYKVSWLVDESVIFNFFRTFKDICTNELFDQFRKDFGEFIRDMERLELYGKITVRMGNFEKCINEILLLNLKEEERFICNLLSEMYKPLSHFEFCCGKNMATDEDRPYMIAWDQPLTMHYYNKEYTPLRFELWDILFDLFWHSSREVSLKDIFNREYAIIKGIKDADSGGFPLLKDDFSMVNEAIKMLQETKTGIIIAQI